MASPLMLGGSPAHSESYSSLNSPPSSSPVRRKPLPQNVDLIPGPVHPSSPLSIEGDKPTPIPTAPVDRPPSPSSADGDSLITVQKNPNRYATPYFYLLKLAAKLAVFVPTDVGIERDMADTGGSASL